MTQLIEFGTSHYNPDLVYKIERVVETVTFTVLVAGLPAGNLQEEDIVFGSEAEAITEVARFIFEARNNVQISRNELLKHVAGGILANPDLTKGFEKTFGLSDAEKEDRLASFVERVANAIKLVADL